MFTFLFLFLFLNRVKVFSKSAIPGSKGYLWESDGSGTYTIREAEGVSRGTKIVIHLKEKSGDFSVPKTVENIIKKYSNFVGVPIKLNGDNVNTIKALWALPKVCIEYSFLVFNFKKKKIEKKEQSIERSYLSLTLH